MELARELVSIFYGEADARAAEEAFVRLFQHKESPEDMPEFVLKPGATVLDVLMEAGLVSSKSEARRLIDQKGIRLDGEALERADLPFPHPGVLQAGKRRFVRVK
jgi:tyrosyl-tRNA synthetase